MNVFGPVLRTAKDSLSSEVKSYLLRESAITNSVIAFGGTVRSPRPPWTPRAPRSARARASSCTTRTTTASSRRRPCRAPTRPGPTAVSRTPWPARARPARTHTWNPSGRSGTSSPSAGGGTDQLVGAPATRARNTVAAITHPLDRDLRNARLTVRLMGRPASPKSPWMPPETASAAGATQHPSPRGPTGAGIPQP